LNSSAFRPAAGYAPPSVLPIQPDSKRSGASALVWSSLSCFSTRRHHSGITRRHHPSITRRHHSAALLFGHSVAFHHSSCWRCHTTSSTALFLNNMHYTRLGGGGEPADVKPSPNAWSGSNGTEICFPMRCLTLTGYLDSVIKSVIDARDLIICTRLGGGGSLQMSSPHRMLGLDRTALKFAFR
jgi:hypothetical protein